MTVKMMNGVLRSEKTPKSQSACQTCITFPHTLKKKNYLGSSPLDIEFSLQRSIIPDVESQKNFGCVLKWQGKDSRNARSLMALELGYFCLVLISGSCYTQTFYKYLTQSQKWQFDTPTSSTGLNSFTAVKTDFSIAAAYPAIPGHAPAALHPHNCTHTSNEFIYLWTYLQRFLHMNMHDCMN